MKVRHLLLGLGCVTMMACSKGTTGVVATRNPPPEGVKAWAEPACVQPGRKLTVRMTGADRTFESHGVRYPVVDSSGSRVLTVWMDTLPEGVVTRSDDMPGDGVNANFKRFEQIPFVVPAELEAGAYEFEWPLSQRVPAEDRATSYTAVIPFRVARDC